MDNNRSVVFLNLNKAVIGGFFFSVTAFYFLVSGVSELGANVLLLALLTSITAYFFLRQGRIASFVLVGYWGTYYIIATARCEWIGLGAEDVFLWVFLASIIVFNYYFAVTKVPRIKIRSFERCLDSFFTNAFNPGIVITIIIVYTLLFVYETIITAGSFMSYLVTNYGELYLPGWLFVVRISVSFLFSVLVWPTALGVSRAKLSVRMLSWIGLLNHLVITILRGSTGGVLTFSIPLVVYYLFIKADNPKQRNKFMIVTIVLILISTTAAFVVRDNRAYRSIGFSLEGDILQRILIEGRTIDGLDNSILIYESYRGSYEFGLNTIVYPVVNFIPRSLWPSKPVGIGRKIVIDLMGGRGSYFDTTVSFTSGTMGEFYLDFGFFGVVVILPIILRLLVGGFEDYLLRKTKERTESYFMLTALALMSMNIAGSFQGFAIRFIYSFAGVLAISVIAPLVRRDVS